MIEFIGYWFCIVVGLLALACGTWLVAILNIMASKYFLDMLGGWSEFNKFRKWKKDESIN